MQPILHPGDLVVGIKFLFIKLKIGDVLIFEKDKKRMIKRITEISQNVYRVQGDNVKFSTDSRHFGDVKNNEVIGKVIALFHAHE